MNIISSFSPFIAFFVLTSFASPLVGLAAATVVSAYLVAHDWRRGKNIKFLGAGCLILFGAMTLLVMVVKPNLKVGGISLVVNGGLMLISLTSLLIGQPFTLQYAKEQIPEQHWNNPIFIRTNGLLTCIWTLAFAVSTLATAASLYLPAIPRWTEIASPIAGLVVAAWFTSWYPARVRRAHAQGV